jgi:hypothetical protein
LGEKRPGDVPVKKKTTFSSLADVEASAESVQLADP